jgi:hypothetical protein
MIYMGMFCHNCGNALKMPASFCESCGAKVNTTSVSQAPAQEQTRSEMPVSECDWTTTLLFCVILGYLGVDRFYVGKIWTGILKLITGGGCFIWWIIDLIMLATGNYTDSKGLKIQQKPKDDRIF